MRSRKKPLPCSRSSFLNRSCDSLITLQYSILDILPLLKILRQTNFKLVLEIKLLPECCWCTSCLKSYTAYGFNRGFNSTNEPPDTVLTVYFLLYRYQNTSKHLYSQY